MSVNDVLRVNIMEGPTSSLCTWMTDRFALRNVVKRCASVSCLPLAREAFCRVTSTSLRSVKQGERGGNKSPVPERCGHVAGG